MRPLPRCLTAVLVGLALCVACGGASFTEGPGDAGRDGAGGTDGGGDGRLDGPGPDDGTGGDGADDGPLDGGDEGGVCAQAMQGLGVFVAPPTTPMPMPTPAPCGTKKAPCGSVKDGIAAALAAGKPRVYLAAGTYLEDGIALQRSVNLYGGFHPENDWARPCPPSAADTTLQAVADTVTVRATDLGGTALLDALTIASKATANHDAAGHGESLYGIFASGASTVLEMDDVVVTTAAAGRGNDGAGGKAPGDPGAPGSCAPSSVPPGGDGAAGTSSSGASAGSFGPSGYTPGDSASGMDGGKGGDGPCTAPTESCLVCTRTTLACATLEVMPRPGTPGCGGNGGGGGQAGLGGGSAVALFTNAAKVTVLNGSLFAGDGGNGGNGGIGPKGGAPGTSMNGPSTQCCNGCGSFTAGCKCQSGPILPGATCSTPGGGGDGGSAGGAAGGSSYAIVRVAGGEVTMKGTSLAHGQPGKGGQGGATGNAPGANGNAGDMLGN
jgi:hypothetical protein